MSCEFELREGLMTAVDGNFTVLIFTSSRVEGERYSFIRSRFEFYLKCTDIHVVWRDYSLVSSGLLILISLCANASVVA